MKKTLSTNQVAHALVKDEYANWSYAGAMALAEYLEQYEEDCGTEIEFCPVALRCDFSEYDSLKEWAKEYTGNRNIDEALADMGIDDEDCDQNDDEVDDAIREYIQDHGQLIEFDGGIIVSSF